jgi:hypothetical protein
MAKKKLKKTPRRPASSAKAKKPAKGKMPAKAKKPASAKQAPASKKAKPKLKRPRRPSKSLPTASPAASRTPAAAPAPAPVVAPVVEAAKPPAITPRGIPDVVIPDPQEIYDESINEFEADASRESETDRQPDEEPGTSTARQAEHPAPSSHRTGKRPRGIPAKKPQDA